jgi:prepilin-type N-terminal cleavage/methylation domain-containing protein
VSGSRGGGICALDGVEGGLRDEDDGFTLIELMVVVMILAILIVMGMPTFLGVRARFQDRGAQTDLRNACLAARILYTDNATFTPATSAATGLVTIVPNMCYVAGTAATKSVDTGRRCLRERGPGPVPSASTRPRLSSRRLACQRRNPVSWILDP